MSAVAGRLAALVEAAHARLGAEGRLRTYGLLDFAAGEEHLQAPYVAVFPLAESAGENMSRGADLTGALDSQDAWGRADSDAYAPSPAVQRVEATLGVVCCVASRHRPAMRQLDDDAAPRRDGDPDARLAALVDAVRGQLLGWLPDPAWWPLELARGRLLSAQAGRAHWQDEYRCSRLVSGGGVQPGATPSPTEVCVDVNGAGEARLELA